jgi:hypothetical protein
MTQEFVIWKWSPKPKWSIPLSKLLNFPKSFLLHDGVPLAGAFPNDVAMTMDPDHPRDTVATDNLFNTNRLLIASERLKEFLEKRQLTAVEYLPIAILDLKHKPLPQRYFIVNPLEHLDCLDVQHSGPTQDEIDDEYIDDVKRIVLDPSRLDDTRELFRIARFNRVTLASRALAAAIDEAGFTSIAWTELKDYKP